MIPETKVGERYDRESHGSRGWSGNDGWSQVVDVCMPGVLRAGDGTRSGASGTGAFPSTELGNELKQVCSRASMPGGITVAPVLPCRAVLL